MEKEFVSYEQAVALKELGFGAPPLGGFQQGSVFYFEDGKLYYDGHPMYSSTCHEGIIMAPLKQQVFRWFREKYGYDSQVTYTQNKYLGFVADHKTGYYLAATNDFSIHEEAEDALIDKLIELIKQQAK